MKLRRLLLILSAVLVFSCFSAVVSADTVEAPSITSTNVASTGKIKLTWDAVKGADEYNVYRSTSKTGAYIFMKCTTGTKYTNTSAVAGVRYYYYVEAVDKDTNSSAKSHVVSRTCDLAQPEISVGNVASSGKVKLMWKAVDKATSYKVYRSNSKNGSYSLIKTTTDTSLINSSAVAGKLYYYKVRAISSNTAANSAYSAVKSRRCDLPRPQVTISNVSSSGKIKLSWGKVDGAVNYKVYRATSKHGAYSLMKTTTGNSYTNTSAVAEKTYYYKVKAMASNSAANSSYSVVKSRTCDLAQPQINVSNVSSSGKIKLTWKSVNGADAYEVYRSMNVDGTYTLMKTVTGTSYTNTSAKAGICYYYKVKAIASVSAANSAYSATASRTCDLPRPSDVKITLNSKGNPKLTWSAIEGAEKYEIYRSLKKSSEYELIKTTTSTSFTNTSVNLDTTYYYKVKALASNEAANSATSTVVSITTNEYVKRYICLRHAYVYVEPDSNTEKTCLLYMTEFELGKAVHEYTSGTWYKLRYNGRIYYMWLAAGDKKFTDKRSSFVYKTDNPYAQEIVDLAYEIYSEWDTHYVSGATGQTNSKGVHGFDCTGFTTYCVNTVMQKYNPAYRITPNIKKLYDLENIYNDNIKGEFNAITVSLEDIQPGDFIFLAMNDGVNMDHAAIYLGNGELIHMMGFYDKVTIMPLEGYYAERICRIKRFIPEELIAANKTMYSKSNYVKMYAERGNDESHMYTCTKNEKITVLYTYEIREGLTQAYCLTSGGKKGFIYLKNLSSTKV